MHVPYTKASRVQWQTLQADGMAPMGTALKMAKAMIDDKNTTPSRAYRPTIVLVSDGQPNDDWEKPLEDFISNGRSSKCFCVAMAIGRDADEDGLRRFISKTPFLAKRGAERRFPCGRRGANPRIFPESHHVYSQENTLQQSQSGARPVGNQLDGCGVRPGKRDDKGAEPEDEGYF